MKKVYEASTPGFSRVMSNVASLFSSRTMSALPAVATLLCLSFVGTNIAYAQPCAGVSCDISYNIAPPPLPANPLIVCLNANGEAQITPGLMGGYTTSSNMGCCTIVRVWENAAATNPLTPADPDYDLDCTDIGRTIQVWVTREVNLPPTGYGRSAPLPFTITVADCTNPTITCPAPETLTCATDYTNNLPPNPMSYDDFNNLGGGANVADNADACGPTGFEVSYSDVISNVTCLNRFTVTRTYVATDPSGNTASCVQVITVSDNVAPDITTLPQDLTLNCPDITFGPAAYAAQVAVLQVQIQAWLNNFGGGVVSDNCGGFFINANDNFGLNILLCLAFDPVLGCTNSTPLSAATVWDQMPQACSPQPREVQVMFVVKDECDNQSFATAKVILVDNEDPGPSLLGLATALNPVNGGNILPNLPGTLGGLGAYSCADLIAGPNIESVRPYVDDNCTPVEDLLIEFVEDNPTSVDGCNTGLNVDVIQRVYRVTDCAGNSETFIQNIRVRDIIAPDWTNDPNNLVVACDDPALSTKIQDWLDSYGTDGAVDDNCNNVTVTNNYATVSVGFPNWCPPPAVGAELNTPFRSLIVTWTATDDCGNSSTRTARLRLRDDQPPTGTAPADITVGCVAGADGIPVPDVALITDEADNCSDVVAVAHVSTTVVWNGTGCEDDPIIYRRNYSLTDCAGNSRVVTQYITVADLTAPVWGSDPANHTVDCPLNAAKRLAIAQWLNNRGGASATDNCGSVTYTTNPTHSYTNVLNFNIDNVLDALGDCAPANGSVVVTFIASDACGNTATKTATLTVNDNIPPTASTPIASNYNCLDEVPAPNVNVVTNEDDSCSPNGSVTVEYIGQTDNGGAGCVGDPLILSRTYRVMDCAFEDVATTPNNYIDVVHTITVVDNVVPNANCKPYTAYLGADGTVTVNATDFDDNSEDNCDGDLTYEFARDEVLDDLELIYGAYTEDKVFDCDDIVPNLESCAGNVNNSEVIGIRLRVFDACGNPSGFCTTALTLIDSIKPTIDCPDDRTVNTDEDGGYDCQVEVTIEHPTPEDNCDVVCYEMEVQKEINGVWTTINPEFGNPEPNFRVDVLGVTSSTYIFDKGPYCNPDQIDDMYRIIYYVRDEHGNSLAAPCSYDIKIMDNEAPVFTYCPSAPIIEALTVQNDCYQMKCWAPPTFYDNCQYPFAGEGSGECPIPTMSVSAVSTYGPHVSETVMVDTIGDDHCALFPVGTTEVTYTVTDICGNSNTCVVTIIISDTEAPMAMCVGDYSVNLQPNGLLELTFANIDAGSSDNCGLCVKEIGRVYTPDGPVLFGPTVMLTCDDVANSPIEITLRVKDCGIPVQNESECTVQVTVEDMQLPGIATCPADIIVCTGVDSCKAVVDYDIPTFNDGCGSQHDGTLQIGLRPDTIFPIGTTLVAWDYTSASGYNVVCQFNVTVEDCQAPNMVCPPNVQMTCLEPLCCPEDFTGGTLTDNCGVTLLQSSDFDNNLSHCIYDGVHVVVRTYTAWDAAGNTSTCQRTYTWTEDTELPVLVQKPGDLSFECAADVPAPPVQSATDNCGTVNIDFVEVVQNNLCVNQTVIIRTWTATDLCGNTTQHVQTITVNDDDIPTFTDTPDDVTEDCSEDVPDVENPTIDDNCDIFTVDFVEVVDNGGCEDRQTVYRTWTATDLCGNTATFTQTITIYDGAAPSITNVAANYDGQCATEVPAVVAPTISDNCVQFTVDFSETLTPGGCEDNFTLTRRWLATDACGNQTVAFQVITINDTTDPELIGTTAAGDETVECAADVPAVATITASDNCGEPLTVDFSEVQVPGACVNQYVITRTWTAEDDCGNSTQHVQTITVFDGEAPTFSATPADYSDDCSEDVLPVVAPVVDDNCDIFTVDFSETTAPGGCEDRFVIARTWVATDLCGNTSTYTQYITIYDGEAPKFSNVPLSVSEDCATDVPAVVHPNVSDNCSQVVVDFSETTAPGGCEDNFTVTRTWVATDACGNSASVSQVIVINDNTDPVLVGLPANQFPVFDCSQDVPPVANVTATDNCGEPLTVDFVEVNIPGTCQDRFWVRRTWSAEDDCGNRTSFTQLITIFDNVDPVLTNTPQALVNVECAEDVPAMPIPPVGATDNCGAPVDVEFSELEIPGECPNEYSIRRRWTAEDACGNITTFVQVINVSDTEAPELTNLPAALVEVDCADEVPAMPNPPVGATDNCGAPVDVEFSEVEIPGNCPNQYSITRTWTAEDVCGNTTVFVQTINIFDDEAPVLTVTPVDRTYECYDEVPAAPIDQQAIDNCDIAFIDFSESVEGGTNQDPNWSCPNNVTITRRWVATDLCGNTVEHIQEIRVHDEIPPSWVDFDPKDRHYDCLDDVLPAPDQQTLAADNCEVVVVDFLETRADDSCHNQVTIIRRWEATDLCGNKSTRWQYLYVRDTIAPVFPTTPTDRNYDCVEDVETAPINNATDNCQVVNVDFAEFTNPGDCPSQVVINRRWVATDLCGNTAEHWQTITVNDDEAPVLSATPFDLSLECSDNVPAAPVITASDNCDDVLVEFSESTEPGACPNQYVVTRHWQAADLCGNSVEWYQTITVNDNDAPVVTAPAGLTLDCGDINETLDPSASVANWLASATATDNCDQTVDITYDFNATDLNVCVGGTLTVTWTATDACGNVGTSASTITIVPDTEDPIVTAPSAITLDCGDINETLDPSATISNWLASATATDNCDTDPELTYNFDVTTLDVCVGGTLTVTWTATDACGNVGTSASTITVVPDTEDPIVTAPAAITLNCGDISETSDPSATISNWLASATATDNCDTDPELTYNFDITTLDVCVGGTLTVTWTATDACGNVGTSASTITVVPDTEKPVITVPAALVLDCGDISETADPAAQIAAWLATASATDNCDTDPELSHSFDISELNICAPATYTITVTWTANDACNNSTQKTQTITVIPDTEKPSITVPAPLVLDCGDISETADPAAQIAAWLATASASDNCDTDPELNHSFSMSELNICAPATYTITVTWTANDACNNSTQKTQTITVIPDTEKPSITVPAPLVLDCGDISETADPAAQIAAWLATASASDNCDTDPELNHSFSMSELNICAPATYTITVTWTANDACNNSTQKTQTITVIPDTEKPSITVPAPLVLDCGDISETADPAAQIAAWLATASASDNCDTDPELNHSFNISELNVCAPATYTITVTWTANDACNNSTQKTQTITVIPDTEKPVITVPAPLVLDCGDISETADPAAQIAAWLATASASDNCDTDPELNHSFNVSELNICAPATYTITVTWTANDACNNSTQKTQTITVIPDTEKPIVTAPAPITLDCGDISETSDPSAAISNWLASATATDNCDTDPELTYNFDVTTLDVCVGGTLTVTWTATDACGNVGTSASTITVVPDTEDPVVTAPAPLTLNCDNLSPNSDPSAAVLDWLAAASASDNCDTDAELNYDFDITTLNVCVGGTLTVTWTATDACGNIGTAASTITVVPDTEAPVLVGLPDATVNVDCADEVPAVPVVTATDNCSSTVDVEFSEVEIPGNCANQYSITRTWTAEDFCGNTTVFIQTINIYDDEAPVLTVTPVDRTYECFDEVPSAPLNQSAIDNCDIAFVDFSESTEGGTPQDPNWSCPNNVTITRRWIATDLCGNTTEHIQVIRVHDTTPPGWIDFDPKDRYYDCLDDVEGAPDQQTLAGDNCEVVFVDFLETRDNDSCHNQVIIKRRWEATDLCGNKSTRWQYLYVRDTIAPIFRTTPTDRTFECSEDVPVAPIQIAEDNCQVVSVDFAETTEPGGCLNQYVITRRWYAYDVCGNTAEHWQTITVNDNIAPTWTSALPADVTVDCGEDVTPATLTASDNCAAPVDLDYNEDILPGAGPNDGVRLVRTWTATDACGNSIVHTQVVTINDIEAPVLGNLPPATVSVECSEEVPAVAAVTYTDNCQGTVDFDFTEVEVPGTCPNQYQIVRTWTATDFAGNTTQFVQTITINDTEAPQWNNVIPVVWINEIHYDNVGTDAGEFIEVAGTAGVDLSNYSLVLYNGANGLQYGTMSLNGVLGNQSNGFGAASFSYPVNGVQNGSPDGIALVLNNTMVLQFLSYEGAFLAVDGPATGMMSTNIGVQEDGSNPIGTSLSLIGTGNAYASFSWSGPSASSPGNLNNGQTMTAPAGFALPLDLAVQCGEDVPMPVVLQATDNCNAPVDVEFNEVFAPGAGPNDGFVITRTWTAEDDCGNAIVHTQVITVNDTQDPALGNLPAATVNVVCAEDVPAVADVTYTDNCEGTVDLDFFETIQPGDCAHRFTLVRTWTATDFAGNTTQFVQTINVNDNVAPTWTSALPADVTLQCGENVTPATMTASDNCAGAVLVEFNETILPGAGPNDGNLLVRTWTAYDVCGNSIQHTQEVYINDTQAPALLNTPAATVNVVCAENVPAVANVTATDNCQGTVDADFNETILPGDCAHRFTLTRTWTATDFAGNSTQFVQTINVNDNVAPTWTSALPADVTLQCGENVTPATLTASDNCSGVVVIEMNETILPGAGPNDGNLLARTWTAYDVCGNSIQHTQTIYVNDTQAPALQNTPAATVNVVCSEDVPAVANVTATDNCLGTVDVDFNETILLGDCVHNFTLTRTWSATDFAGNTTQFVQTINVNDNVAPTWTSALPADVTLQCGENVTPATLTASDNCSGQVIIEMNETVLPGAGPNDGGVLTRTWTAYDVCGNSIQHVQTLTILDNVAPVLGNLPVATVNIQCSTDIPAVANVTVSDNCQGTVDMDYTESILLGNCINQYTLTRTWLATDFAGNTAVFVQTINVNDTQAPVWNQPAPTNVSVSCAADVPAAPTQTATDNCGVPVITDFSEIVQPGNCLNRFTLVRTWSVQDDCGNATSRQQTITVSDDIAPVMSCPAPLQAQCSPAEQPPYANLTEFTTAGGTASDNCGLNVSSFGLLSETAAGNVYTRTYRVVDQCGNAGTCQQTVTVLDTQAPVFLNCPTGPLVFGNDPDQCSAKINWPQPVAVDNCSIPTVVQTAGPTAGSVVPVGNYTVTFRATDAQGNVSFCTFQVMVMDTEKPEFDADILMPGDVTVECDAVPAPFVLTNNDVNDNCTPSNLLVITFTEVRTNGNCAFNYTLTRTWRVTDQAGNQLVHTQIVTVRDTKAPTAICKNATVTLDKAGNASITAALINNGSFDNCSAQANLTLTVTPSSFTCANLGNNTVTLTVTDQCGNSATCTAVVTVLEGIGPCVPQYSALTVCAGPNGTGNATTLDNGQFIDRITVKSLAMQTWTVVSNTGLYLVSSPAPPAAPTPLPVGTAFTMGNLDGIDNDGNGQVDEANEMVFYTLRGVHVDGIGYSITIQNNLGQTATISNKAFYPTPVFLNLDGPFCLNTPPFTIQVADTYGAAGNIVPGSVMINGVAQTTFNAAALGVGNHTVMATFDASAQGITTNLVINGVLVGGTVDQALANSGCQQKITKVVQVVATPTTIVCNDLVNVSISNDGGNCVFELAPDNVLEGSYLCDDDYSVVITYPAGTNTYNPADRVDNTHIGKTLNYTLVHSQSGNICWGKIKVEDKEAPKLTCPGPITIACSDPTSPSFTGQVIISDCSPTTSVVTDDFTDFGACVDPRAEIVRLWLVTDASGNQATCTQRITIAAFNLNAVIFPADVTLNCATANSTDPSVTGSPSINGTPIGQGGLCMASISRTDDRYEICPGGYEIIRTWKVRNMCLPLSASNPREHQQVIKVIDTQGPTFDCPAAVTVSTDPFNCCATAALPSLIITETCSYVTSLEYRVIGTDFATGNLVIYEGTGFLSDFAGNNYWVPDTMGNFGLTQCLPRGEYNVTYTATDACGNISKCTFKLYVEDQVPPIAVCDEFTQVALGADGMAFINAETFDDGSYDVCESVHFKARRMDANACQSNEFFLDQVKFCCEDINDTILVVFRAYDLPVPAGAIGEDEYENHYNDCMVKVFVEDKIKPLCNAPAQVNVSCEAFDPTLWAYGFATGLDNCCLDTITETRNIALFDTVCNRGTITRTFRVFDCGGNSTTCTQRVIVAYEQDYFVRFPNDVIVTVCDGTGNFGEPAFFGVDCELLGVSHKDDTLKVVPDACYMIERTWEIINWCTYNPNAGCINVPNPNPNPNSQHPSNLPGPTVSPAGTPAPWAPTVVAIQPGQTPTNYSTFWSANANCYTYKQIIKIIDTQKPEIANCPASPVDVCDITPNDGNLWNAMYWWDNTIGSHDLCEAPTDLTITATDLCSGPNINARYLLFLDLDGDGDMETLINSTQLPGFNNVQFGNAAGGPGTSRQFDFRPVPANQKYGFALQTTTSGANKTFSVRWNTQQSLTTYVIPELPYGTHKIKWIVDDGCGNEQVCEYTFIVKDCKKPTVVCINGLSVNIMPTKMITLTDKDFLLHTDDNCTPSSKLVTAIRKAGQGTGFPRNPDGTPQTTVTFTCNELGKQNVEVWSIDLAGNADFCVTYVDVQDNMGNCTNTFAVVSGALKTEAGNGLEDANVELDGASPSNPSVNLLVPSDSDGNFLFTNVPYNGDYTVTPIKDNDPLNGVSTFDLVLINKHILGIEPLNSPYKMIAADANNSRSITTFDIVELRKLILGIYTELPNNTSWRFVDDAFAFPNPLNPFQTIFPETKQLANLQTDALAENFKAVKVGDVNGNAVTSSLMTTNDRTDGTLLFDVQDRTVKAGEVFTVNFRAAERAVGYQFTLLFPNLEVVDVTPVSADMAMLNFGIFNSENSLTTSFDNERVNGEFAVTFRAKAAGTLSQMLAVSGRITKAEAYSLNRERQAIALRFNGDNGSTVSGLGFELYQNQPNPWMNKTQVGFHLPEATNATLTIFDETGRVLFVQKGEFGKGYNAFTIERALVNTTGVLYYQLETATDSATKKMIQTK